MTDDGLQIPRLPAYLCNGGAQLRVWCMFCKVWHLHGSGGDPERPAYSHRVAHCFTLDRRGRPIDSPYKVSGYYLVPPDEPEEG